MFEAADVKREVVNHPGQRLLYFRNNIINLDDVSEILREQLAPPYKIVFIFRNGREREFMFDSRSGHSFGLRRLDHCIEKNLMDLDLTSECYAKWDQYRVDEIERQSKLRT